MIIALFIVFLVFDLLGFLYIKNRLKIIKYVLENHDIRLAAIEKI